MTIHQKKNAVLYGTQSDVWPEKAVAPLRRTVTGWGAGSRGCGEGPRSLPGPFQEAAKQQALCKELWKSFRQEEHPRERVSLEDSLPVAE